MGVRLCLFSMITRHKKLLQKLDIILLIVFPFLAALLSLLLRANYLTSILLFYGLPSVWLSWRTPTKVIKTLIFSVTLLIPLGVVLDYIGTIDHSWFIPTTVFPFRLFNILPLEDFIWFFLFLYMSVIFYEHFFDKGKPELVDKHMKYLAGPLVVLLVLFFVILFKNPALLAVPYAYFWIGLIFMLLPTISFLSFFPRLLAKHVKTGSYFFIHALLFELTGLQLNHWAFPGSNFVGRIELLGYHLPFEEFFFWILLGTISVLCYYEFFDDDRK